MRNSLARLSSPKTEMVSGIFVNESGRMLVSLFVWIGKRVTILLPIFFYHKLAQSLLTMGFGLVVTPPVLQQLLLGMKCYTRGLTALILLRRRGVPKAGRLVYAIISNQDLNTIVTPSKFFKG